MKERKCKAKNKNDRSCKVKPLVGKDYCYFHDPETATKRKADRRKGGLIRMGVVDKPLASITPRSPIELKCTEDILRLLTDTINEVRCGTIEKPAANSIGYLSNIAVKCLEQVEIVKRLEVIESEISKIKEVEACT